MRKLLILSMAAAFALSADDDPLAHISADSLRGHLSFLASDLLEGRALHRAGSIWRPDISLPSSAGLALIPQATTAISRPRPSTSANRIP